MPKQEFKMLIVDDELLIRQSLSDLYDWSSIGIRIVGVCKNGMEALHSILDEAPDLVMTDIRMPGISGLELIEQMHAVDQTIEFIILSGYPDFEFAKQAMHLGVKHYLLKPLNDQQLLAAVEQAKEDWQRASHLREALLGQQQIREKVDIAVRQKFVFELFALKEQPEQAVQEYLEHFPANGYGYIICYFSFLEELHLQQFIRLWQRFLEENSFAVSLAQLYVTNTAVMVLEHTQALVPVQDFLMEVQRQVNDQVEIVYNGEQFCDLLSCTKRLLWKVARYSRVLLVDAAGNCQELRRVEQVPTPLTEDSMMVNKVKFYVQTHLAEDTLSLKWIAEHLLYMNVNYVSHRFANENGEKFSAYLNRMRIDRAKELLRVERLPIYQVAEQIGCGNNPRYFSQLFKKYTGMTPSDYIETET